jgi:hypothetical protein
MVRAASRRGCTIPASDHAGPHHDKATKSESIRDGTPAAERFEILKRDLEIAYLRGEFDATRDQRSQCWKKNWRSSRRPTSAAVLPPERSIRDIGKQT